MYFKGLSFPGHSFGVDRSLPDKTTQSSSACGQIIVINGKWPWLVWFSG